MDHGVNRNAEREIDLAYLSSIVLKLGSVTAPAAAEMVNSARYRRHRDQALADGKSEDEAKQIGRCAHVSVATIRSDLKTLVNRARQAGVAGAVAFLDDQIQAIEDDIEETYRIAAAIWEDIERSRNTRRNRTRGQGFETPNGDSDFYDGENGPREVELIRETTENMPAQAALWGRLVEVTRRRQELREEQRLVRFGQMTFDREAQLSTSRQSIAQVMTRIDDPEAAKEAVLRMIAYEIESLEAAQQMPMSGDMLKLHAMRQDIATGGTKNFRDYLKLAEQVGRNSTFEIAYQLVGVEEEKTGAL